jgi:signal transduction histidine kinase
LRAACRLERPIEIERVEDHVRELIAFDELLRAEVEDRKAHQARVHLDEREPALRAAIVLGDRLALRRIIANLVDNAITYGHAACLSMWREADQLVLAVDDEGPGIPPTSVAPCSSRSPASTPRATAAAAGPGSGLRWSAPHGGSIEIGDAPKGARVVVRLPLYVQV